MYNTTITHIGLDCSAHWKMVVILPKENLVVWFCSLHNRPNNYLKGIIISALKGLDDTPQPKSKAGARWIVVKYFNDVRPLEAERLKLLRIQWAQYYLKVRNQMLGNYVILGYLISLLACFTFFTIVVSF
ncbi:hypothetical protein GmHk_17G049063 [Glycine max]|nr:hypothetical protein GmHk_17G049063 [Glycine max]KAH1202642.1 hypothetical protein GmHk_17G049063 [Glycine max]